METNVENLVTVFGGSGFVGRYLVRNLAKRGWRVRVAVRRPDLVGHLQPMGGVGQIQPVFANVRDPESVKAAAANANAVVNLVGILAQSGHQSFNAIQAEGAKTVAQGAKAAGVSRFVQMSAIGADTESPSEYARTTAAGENAAIEAFEGAVVVRPSIVFGKEDQFFNRFAKMAKLSPVVPVIGPQTRFQPVYVDDVAEFMAASVEGKVDGGTYELGGPEVETFHALMERMLRHTRQKRAIVSVPIPVAKLQAKAFSLLPNPPITEDQIKLLQRDNVVSKEAIDEGRTFAAAAITPESMDTVLPTYLWVFRKHGQFAEPGSAA
ncbi:MAG: complex I NDUFA9 subunit family protein [Pseudomonadota bacterium]